MKLSLPPRSPLNSGLFADELNEKAGREQILNLQNH